MGYLVCLCILTGFMLYGCVIVLISTCGEGNADDNKKLEEFGYIGRMFQAFKCAPWVAWVGANAGFHMFWVTTLTICQFYQVNLKLCIGYFDLKMCAFRSSSWQ